MMRLDFPVFAAILASNENGGGFICTAGLHLVVRAVFFVAFLTGKHIRGRTHAFGEAKRVAFLFL